MRPGRHTFTAETSCGAVCIAHFRGADGRIHQSAGYCSDIEAAGYLPQAEVGSFGSWVKKSAKKVKKVAKKVAKTRAFKALGQLALKAADTYTGGQAFRALAVARGALRGARTAEGELRELVSPGGARPGGARGPGGARAFIGPSASQLGAYATIIRALPAGQRADFARRLLR